MSDDQRTIADRLSQLSHRTDDVPTQHRVQLDLLVARLERFVDVLQRDRNDDRRRRPTHVQPRRTPVAAELSAFPD